MKLNIIKIIIIGALLFASSHLSFSQGFMNLNFESTTLTNNGPPNTGVSTTVALPGWTAYIGGTSQSTILYNNTTAGSSSIAVWGSYSGPGYSFNALQGKFSAVLTAGPSNASISQTGLIPVDTVSILFNAAQFYTPTNFLVSMNGQAINIALITSTANYTVFGGDISAYAGQMANLTFTCLTAYSSGIPLLSLELDNIRFSTAIVPEPGALALAALGAVLFGSRLWKKVL